MRASDTLDRIARRAAQMRQARGDTEWTTAERQALARAWELLDNIEVMPRDDARHMTRRTR